MNAKAPPSATGLLFYSGLLILAGSVFGVWPEIDLWFSRLLWDLNGGAFQKQDGWWSWLYYGTRPVVWGITIVVALLGVASRLRAKALLGITLRRAVFVLLAFFITQALVVDLYLKDGWGRARPREILEFGGQAHFTPFFLVTDQCDGNCSFVSGHAAMAFSLFAFSFLATGPWRGPLFWLALAIGAAASYMRVLQGAHFLSDVVFAGLVVYGVTWLLARNLLGRTNRWLGPG